MQSPVIIFDHVKKVVAIVRQGPAEDDKRLAELAAAQRDQIATASGRPAS